MNIIWFYFINITWCSFTNITRFFTNITIFIQEHHLVFIYEHHNIKEHHLMFCHEHHNIHKRTSFDVQSRTSQDLFKNIIILFQNIIHLHLLTFINEHHCSFKNITWMFTRKRCITFVGNGNSDRVKGNISARKEHRSSSCLCW